MASSPGAEVDAGRDWLLFRSHLQAVFEGTRRTDTFKPDLSSGDFRVARDSGSTRTEPSPRCRQTGKVTSAKKTSGQSARGRLADSAVVQDYVWHGDFPTRYPSSRDEAAPSRRHTTINILSDAATFAGCHRSIQVLPNSSLVASASSKSARRERGRPPRLKLVPLNGTLVSTSAPCRCAAASLALPLRRSR
jgi:hypothetical protein